MEFSVLFSSNVFGKDRQSIVGFFVVTVFVVATMLVFLVFSTNDPGAAQIYLERIIAWLTSRSEDIMRYGFWLFVAVYIGSGFLRTYLQQRGIIRFDSDRILLRARWPFTALKLRRDDIHQVEMTEGRAQKTAFSFVKKNTTSREVSIYQVRLHRKNKPVIEFSGETPADTQAIFSYFQSMGLPTRQLI